MPSRRDLPPTAAELLARTRVAGPARVRAVCVAHHEGAVNFAYVARDPLAVVSVLPSDVRLRVWHRAPDDWRVEGPDGLLSLASGTRVLVVEGEVVRTGGRLLEVQGPQSLLRPDVSPRTSAVLVGPDVRDGRDCWQLRVDDEQVWVDDATGVLLAREGPRGRVELHELEVDLELGGELADDALLDDALFEDPRLPEPWVAPERVRRPPPVADFRTTWWPTGAEAWPVAGSAPEHTVLLALPTHDGVRVWLGIAPRPGPAPERPGTQVLRWQSARWSHALCWEGDLPDPERVAASVPTGWSGW